MTERLSRDTLEAQVWTALLSRLRLLSSVTVEVMSVGILLHKLHAF